MNYIALFFTHSGAIKFSNKLNSINIENVILPVPRKLSSSCGISVKFSTEQLDTLIIKDIDKIFSISNANYSLEYSADS